MTLYLCTEMITISPRGPSNLSNFRFETQLNFSSLEYRYFRRPKCEMHNAELKVQNESAEV